MEKIDLLEEQARKGRAEKSKFKTFSPRQEGEAGAGDGPRAGAEAGGGWRTGGGTGAGAGRGASHKRDLAWRMNNRLEESDDSDEGESRSTKASVDYEITNLRKEMEYIKRRCEIMGDPIVLPTKIPFSKAI